MAPRNLDHRIYRGGNVGPGLVCIFRLVERACALTERRIPALLDTLAATYAEAGDFARGISAGDEAPIHARSSGDNDAVKLSENILATLRENLPYRQELD